MCRMYVLFDDAVAFMQTFSSLYGLTTSRLTVEKGDFGPASTEADHREMRVMAIRTSVLEGEPILKPGPSVASILSCFAFGYLLAA